MKKIIVLLLSLFVFAGYSSVKAEDILTAINLSSNIFPLLLSKKDQKQPLCTGTCLNVSGGKDVPSNIPNGGNNVVLGVFDFNVLGEPISWTSNVLRIKTDTINGAVTNITFVDMSNNVIAGPFDPYAISSTEWRVTLSDTVHLPLGRNPLFVKGNLNHLWEDNETIVVSFNPAEDIIGASGDITGQIVTPTPANTVTAKTKTVRTGSLIVSPSSSFVPRNIIDGTLNVFGQYVLDATASSEDVRVTTVSFWGTVGADASLNEVNSCQLYDVTNGSNRALTTGSNIVNPSGYTAGISDMLTSTIDKGALTVVKGTQMVIEQRCMVNLYSTPTKETTFRFDFSSSSPDWTVTGADTGNNITETLMPNEGATLTVVSHGRLTVSLGSTSPVEMWYVSGEEAINSVYRFVASNEDFSADSIPFFLMSGSPADIEWMGIYQGVNLVSEMSWPAFVGGIQHMNFSLGQIVFPQGDDGIDLKVVIKFSQIGTVHPGTSGNLVKISIPGPFPVVGMTSGKEVQSQGSTMYPSGARYFKALPRKNLIPLPNTVLANGTRVLHQHSVSGYGGDIDIFQMRYYVDTNIGIGMCSLVEENTGKVVANGLIPNNSGLLTVTPLPWMYGSEVITIPEGETYVYSLSCTVTGARGGGYTSTLLLEDEGYFGGNLADAPGYANFLWSDRSARNHSSTTNDWYDGFGIPYMGYQTLSLIEF